MSLTIKTREMGDVLILEIQGRITLGEGTSVMSEETARLLNEGRRKLLLDLRNVSYIDSSGIWALTGAFTGSVSLGGIAKLIHLNGRVKDLLQITKLFTVFEVFDDEAIALRSFAEPLRYSRCPICRRMAAPPAFENAPWEIQHCPSCSSRFAIAAESLDTALVIWLEVRAHENEYWAIRSGPPFIVEIAGRLDLFASKALDKCWNAIPTPRRVLFDLTRAQEITPPGMDALARLLCDSGAGSRARAVLPQSLGDSFDRFTFGPNLYFNLDEALLSLGDLSETPPWSASIGPFYHPVPNKVTRSG